MSLEPHLLLDVREDGLDDEAGRGERALSAKVGGGSGLVGGQQRRAGGCEPRLVLAAPGALSPITTWGGRAGEQVGKRLVLLLVPRHDRVAELQPAIRATARRGAAAKAAAWSLTVAFPGTKWKRVG